MFRCFYLLGLALQFSTGQLSAVCLPLFSVMSSVSQLRTQNVTETSVAVVWTPPPVQYDTYHITFTSQVHEMIIKCRFDF